MKKKENDINIKTIWKWLRSEKGKRYFFVVFYVFFFIFLFIFMNINISDDSKTKETTEDTSKLFSLPFSTSKLENGNYNFTYNVACPNKFVYKGEKTGQEYSFILDDKTYNYRIINGNLITYDDNKISYVDFSNIYFLKPIIKNGKYISETKLAETEEYIYTYEINNSILINYIQEEINILETSEIKVKTNNQKDIKEIEINIKGDNICNIKELVEES